MIQYVVITALIVVVLISSGMFLPGRTNQFGYFGNSFVVWYQKVQSVLSLPFP